VIFVFWGKFFVLGYDLFFSEFESIPSDEFFGDRYVPGQISSGQILGTIHGVLGWFWLNFWSRTLPIHYLFVLLRECSCS
jgi:hypothetical protein